MTEKKTEMETMRYKDINGVLREKVKVSYRDLDKLVIAYRDEGDEEAAAKIIDAFEGYMVKYFNLIRKGRAVFDDRDIREFIKLYTANEYARRNIHRYKYMPAVHHEMQSVADRIRKLYQYCSDDDLIHEIYIAILTMAKRYNPPDKEPRFHTYMVRAFHYQLRRQLQAIIDEELAFKTVDYMAIAEHMREESEYDYYEVEDTSEVNPDFTIEGSMEAFNENWVLGYTTDPIYMDLTVMERRILKMYYIEEMSDQKIADQLGTCRATINRRRNRTKEELKRKFEAEGKFLQDYLHNYIED